MVDEDNKYTTIRLPNFLIEKIDEIVENKDYGYRSRNELCVDALRRFLTDFKKTTTTSPRRHEE